MSQTMTAAASFSLENLQPSTLPPPPLPQLHPHPPSPPPPPRPLDDDQLYHSDDVGLRDTPPLEPKRVNLLPSPSPPLAIPSPEVTPDSSPDPPDSSDRKPPSQQQHHHQQQRHRHRQHRRSRNRPSQGDAVLVHFMDGGKWPEIAFQAGQEPLASDDDDDADEHHRRMTAADDEKDARDVGALAAIAAGALAHQGSAAAERAEGDRVDFMDGVKLTIPSIASTYASEARGPQSHDPSTNSAVLTSPGGLPPIRQHSPESHLSNGNGTGPITLPSLAVQLGDINHLADPGTADPPYPQSPPTRPPPRYASSHASPPQSPSETFRRGLLLSPNNPGSYNYYGQNNRQRLAQIDVTQYATAGEYSSGGAETPSTDYSAPTPSLPIDRMSIDGITNPQVGGFQCGYPGCMAQPFQTQYLLNSHANVHSSIRPHYCPVKGCPRSEGGKGFKRKNEMIRHGLVHESPGYVCPFCPDREHKYPRPDNLQRHVRVHHVDRNKDDQKLRDVLAQRPEGLSRDRRRRGAA